MRGSSSTERYRTATPCMANERITRHIFYYIEKKRGLSPWSLTRSSSAWPFGITLVVGTRLRSPPAAVILCARGELDQSKLTLEPTRKTSQKVSFYSKTSHEQQDMLVNKSPCTTILSLCTYSIKPCNPVMYATYALSSLI